MYKILFLILAILLVNGCKLKETPPAKGSLYITVKDQFGRNVEQAKITAQPVLPEAATDNFGSVLFKDLTVNTYQIVATKQQYGSGQAVALVKADEVVNVSITLEYGVFSSYPPTIAITAPGRPATYSDGENVFFKANLSDRDTPVETLDIRWESSVDGPLNSNKPDKDGIVGFSTAKLSRNNHVIRLIAKDKEGNVGRDSIMVSMLAPKAITLNTPATSNGEVTLNWSKSDAPDFKEYRVYRADKDCDEYSKELVATVQNAGTTSFVDKSPPFTTKACYFVEITTTAQLTKRSNQQTVDFPGGTFLDFYVKDAVLHPTKPWVYLSAPQKQRVVVYDYEAGKTITEIVAPSLSGFLTLGDNGNGLSLYIPNNDNSVLIHDANSYQLKKSLLAGAPATDVAISGTGLVFVSVNNQWTTPLISFNEKSGLLLDAWNQFCLYGGARLRKIPNQNSLMTISTIIGPTDMVLMAYDNNGVIKSCKPDTQHGFYPLDPQIFRIAPKGDYVLTAAEGAGYLTNEAMKYLGQIPRGNIQFSDFAFNTDGSIFYGGTSNRKSVQVGRYPELTRTNEILTRGFPLKVFFKDGKLVVVSRTAQSENAVFVEVLAIP